MLDRDQFALPFSLIFWNLLLPIKVDTVKVVFANKRHGRPNEFFAVGGGGDHFGVLSHVHIPATDRDRGAQGGLLDLEFVELFVRPRILREGWTDHTLVGDTSEAKVQMGIEICWQALGGEVRTVLAVRGRLFLRFNGWGRGNSRLLGIRHISIGSEVLYVPCCSSRLVAGPVPALGTAG